MKQVKIDEAGIIQGSGFDYEIERGTIIRGKVIFDKKNPANSQFTFEKSFERKDGEFDFVSEFVNFRGTYDQERGTLNGTWGKTKDENLGECHFYAIKMARVCVRTFIGGYGNYVD